MDLQRKTLGQLMSNVLGIGNKSKAVKVDADELDADTTQDDEQDAADEADESADDAENDDEADQQEEARKKKAAAPKAKKAAGAAPGAATPANVTMSLAEYNALKADADQAKTLKAANTTLKTKASARDAHQKAIGGAAPKADTTNDAPETEENTEAREMNCLRERYKGMIPA